LLGRFDRMNRRRRGIYSGSDIAKQPGQCGGAGANNRSVRAQANRGIAADDDTVVVGVVFAASTVANIDTIFGVS